LGSPCAKYVEYYRFSEVFLLRLGVGGGVCGGLFVWGVFFFGFRGGLGSFWVGCGPPSVVVHTQRKFMMRLSLRYMFREDVVATPPSLPERGEIFLVFPENRSQALGGVR